MYSRDCNLTPANQVIKMKWSRAGEHVSRYFRVDEDALNEHPKDWGLENAHYHQMYQIMAI